LSGALVGRPTHTQVHGNLLAHLSENCKNGNYEAFPVDVNQPARQPVVNILIM
jgi:hypothetical protein